MPKQLRENHRGREIHTALERLGGIAHVPKIVQAVIRGRRERGEPIPTNIAASVRNGLQRHNSKSPHYGGHDDWFRNPSPGIWELVSHALEREKRLGRVAGDALLRPVVHRPSTLQVNTITEEEGFFP